MEYFQTWDKADRIDSDGDPIIGADHCKDFDKELWFELGKYMWRKHRSKFQDHIKYTNNEIVNPYRVSILQYEYRVNEMHYLAKYLLTP